MGIVSFTKKTFPISFNPKKQNKTKKKYNHINFFQPSQCLLVYKMCCMAKQIWKNMLHIQLKSRLFKCLLNHFHCNKC